MIVLDSSAAVDYVAGLERGQWVEEQLLADRVVQAPHLLDAEIAGALRKLWLRGQISDDHAHDAFATFARLSIRRYPHVRLLERVWELRRSVTAADAMYVALAEALDAPLVTTDLRLARSHGHRARIVAP